MAFTTGYHPILNNITLYESEYNRYKRGYRWSSLPDRSWDVSSSLLIYDAPALYAKAENRRRREFHLRVVSFFFFFSLYSNFRVNKSIHIMNAIEMREMEIAILYGYSSYRNRYTLSLFLPQRKILLCVAWPARIFSRYYRTNNSVGVNNDILIFFDIAKNSSVKFFKLLAIE